MKRFSVQILLLNFLIVFTTSQVVWAQGPMLFRPTNDATVEDTTPRLEWQSTCDNYQGGDCSYRLNIIKAKNGHTVVSIVTNENTYDVPYVEGENTERLEINTLYKWTVTTIYSGSISMYPTPGDEVSDPYLFTTGGYPWICNEDENDIDNYDQDCDGIPDIVEDNIGTNKQEKTLFVRPIKEYINEESGNTEEIYWEEFIRVLFPQPDHLCKNRCIAHIPAFVDAGIEVVVIGCSTDSPCPETCPPQSCQQLWPKFEEFKYDPANSNPDLSKLPDGKLPCSIMNIVLKPSQSYCDTFCDDNRYKGHTHLSGNPVKTVIATPEIQEEIYSYIWTWSTMGFTPSNEKHHGYFIPLIYPLPLDKYFDEGAYSQLTQNQIPATTNCSITTNQACGNCVGENCFSPMNLNGDYTVEFNPIILDDNGKIMDVYPNEETEYRRSEVLKRTIVHEMGHALLGASQIDHCSNPNCIMYGSIVNWSILNNYGSIDPSCEPDDAHPHRQCCTHRSDIKARGIILNLPQ